MKNKIILSLLLSAVLAGMYSCKKGPDLGVLNTGNYKDTAETLKNATSIPIGFGAYMKDAGFNSYFPIIANEGSNITMGNEMKYGSVVRDNGTLNFTDAEALYAAANAKGLKVFGHTLLWHSQQNATFLSTIAGNGAVMPGSFITNSGFESSTGASNVANWNSWGGSSTREAVNNPSGAHSGNNYLRLVLPATQANNWSAQCVTDNLTLTPGIEYVVVFYAKGKDANSKLQVEVQTGGGTNPANLYGGNKDLTTSWASYSFPFTPTSAYASARVVFDFGLISQEVHIDDVVLCKKADYDAAIAAATGPAIANRLDSVMGVWINGTDANKGIVRQFKGRVFAWDVANEVLADNGNLRLGNNTDQAVTKAPGYFSWLDRMGKQGIVSAFKHAKAADPAAKLFINDYNLEYSKAKVDSLVSLVEYLKNNGAVVDGIGTQMHCNALASSYAGIDYMFQKLAATGLQIRISELDVTIKPSPTDASLATSEMLGYQAAMYKYIVDAYIKYVPAAQRYGITIWGVNDADSWRKSQLPLLWDANFKKKPAYAAVLQALKASKNQ